MTCYTDRRDSEGPKLSKCMFAGVIVVIRSPNLVLR